MKIAPESRRNKSTVNVHHSRPFEPSIKSHFWKILSTFGDKCPRNGSKTVPTSQNRPLGYPHKGPSVGFGMSRRATGWNMPNGDFRSWQGPGKGSKKKGDPSLESENRNIITAPNPRGGFGYTNMTMGAPRLSLTHTQSISVYLTRLPHTLSLSQSLFL